MRSRVLTAIGLIPFVLGALFSGYFWPLILLGLAVILVCDIELDRLLKRRFRFGMPLLTGLLALLGCLETDDTQKSVLIVCVALLGTGVGCAATYACCTKSKNWLTESLAPLWFIAPVWCLLILHALIPKGLIWYFANPALMAIVPLWGGDTAAIFVGKAFGKHPLAPAISPKKTIEGAVGNLIACVAVATPLGIWIGYPWWISLICGVLAGVFGQLGDLFESYVKRQAGVKDSGGILPGHGGLLDRIDSILFTAPAVTAVLAVAQIHTR